MFGNPKLCAQFLRNYTDIEILKNVQEKDIENVTERFLPMFINQKEADIVNRIHLPGEDIFLISLIEHKSDVDYNVAMQLFYYMAFIWHDYTKECEKLHDGITATESFRYPAILPIVYFEGTGKWSASTHLKDRIQTPKQIAGFSPDFEYKLIRLHDFSQDDLLEKKDELSFLLMVNKLRDIQDFRDLKLPDHYAEQITSDSSVDVRDVMAKIVSVMLRKIEVPEDTISEITSTMRRGNMGEFMKYFNQEGYSVRKVTEEVTERVTKEVTTKVTKEVTTKVTKEVTKEVTKKVTKEVTKKVTTENLISLVCKKMAKGKSLSQIADDLETDESTVAPIIEFAKPYAPAYEEKQVIKAYWENLIHDTETP